MRLRIKKAETNGVSDKTIYWFFRNCKLSDFTQRNYQPSEAFKLNLEGYLCPDIDEKDNQLILENIYSDESFRKSISVEITRCNSKINTKC